PNASMCWARSRAMSNARAQRSLAYQRLLAGTPLKPIPSPSKTWPAYRTETFLSIGSPPSATIPKDRCGHGRRATRDDAPVLLHEWGEHSEDERSCQRSRWSEEPA